MFKHTVKIISAVAFFSLVNAVDGQISNLPAGVREIGKGDSSNNVSVIPQVAEMKAREGVFNLDARTIIVTSQETKDQANALAKMLAPATGFRLKTRSLGEAQKNAFVLRLNPALAEMGDEGYALDVTADRVFIEAFKPAGLFYGIQTLRQLLPPELDSPKPVMNVTWSVPCVEMRDQPRFPWRGFMLDSCRHFQSVSAVKQVVDLMARYKLNRLHWHLTEDEAWRVEVPGYPKLTDIGAWRSETNNPHYGGFYTAKEIREVIDYAKERFVMVYPEIEMPGHATAALAAHPEFTCKGQAATQGAPGLRYFYATSEDRKAFCPSRPETFTFLEDVVGKVAAMFDSPYIHIGADEVPRKQWSDCTRCQAFIGQQQLKDVVGLQGYFSQRMATYVKSLNKEPIYWGVDLDRFIPTNMIVQAWHPGECLMAIRRGFRTINSDCGDTYINRSAGPGDPDEGSLPRLTIDRVYAFDPVPAGAMADQARLIMGSEASLWTERIPEDKTTTKMFPRLFAFAEVLWSPRRPRDIADLRTRIAPQLARFDLMKIPYFVESTGVSPTAKPTPKKAVPNTAEPQSLPLGIGLSCVMPLVGQSVTLSIPGAAGKICRIIAPKGEQQELSLDNTGHATWTPLRYGKHLLLCGEKSEEVWVITQPLFFHWSSDRYTPRYATIVMTSRPDYWRIRGVTPVRWQIGEYAARTNGDYRNHLYSKPEQWVTNWCTPVKGKETLKWDGMALDEMICGHKSVTLALAEAVTMMRKRQGDDYMISVYSCGATTEFEAGAKLLLDSKALCLIESYHGTEKAFLGRWNAMKKYGLEKNTIFAIGPGFKLKDRPKVHGPLTEAEIKEEFAKVRRVAPESPGIGIYSCISPADRVTIQPMLDAACSQAFEDYFLKPVVCFSPVQEKEQRRFAAWNIGNEDAEGFRVQWLDKDAKPVGKEIPLPALRPQAQSLLDIPEGATSLHLMNPPGTANIYSNGLFVVQAEDNYILENTALGRTFSTDGGILRTIEIVNKRAGYTAKLTNAPEFQLRLSQGTQHPETAVTLTTADFKIVKSSRENGSFVFNLENADRKLRVDVRYALAPGDFYIRKRLTITSAKPVTLERIDVESLNLPDAYQPFTNRSITANAPEKWSPGLGQPLYTSKSAMFWGIEFPAADNHVKDGVLSAGYLWGRELKAEQPYQAYIAVMGVADDPSFIPDAFFEYIDRVRIRPLRLQVQYNSWFDYGNGVNRETFAKSVSKIHLELAEKRKTRPLKMYVIDDGWQDNAADWSDKVWKVNGKFDADFASSQKAVKDAASKLGLWLSPGCLFGSHGQVAKLRGAGFEALDDWMSLAGPRYMQLLEDRIVELTQQGVGFWKLDGLFGHLNLRNFELHGGRYGLPEMPQLGLEGLKAGSVQLNDAKYDELKIYYLTAGTERLMQIFKRLAGVDPDIYIVISNGAYLSPWWLMYVDAVWMINADDAAGGSLRTAELVYRDSRYYKIWKEENTQFPICSVFNHEPKKTSTGESKDEFLRYLYMSLSRGTGFIELYIKPFVIQPEDWDVLSEGLNWAEAVFPTFKRARMHGGRPNAGEVYGYTAWNKTQGYISVHNPSTSSKTYTIKLDRAFGLLPDKRLFHISSPLEDSLRGLPTTCMLGDTLTFDMKPRDIRILNFNTQTNGL